MAKSIEMAYARSVADVAAALNTDPEVGLGAKAVELQMQRYGPNKLLRQEKKSVLRILLHQFKGFIVWLLAAAAALSFAFGDLPEGMAILVVLVINSAIGFFTELRAARSMEALLGLAEVRARVRRDGSIKQVDAQELVPGDVVILEAGDVVTADLRIIEASNLQIDESILTGESVPVAKNTEVTQADALIGDRFSAAFKGTAITQGAGEGIVVATGMATEIGHISALVHGAKSVAAPLEQRLDRLGHRLVWLTIALAMVTAGLGILRGHPVLDMVQTGVALAVAAVPEGLPIVATLTLARGMWRMAQRNALITQLSSVETLGAATIILTDKTGTLTENRMTAVRYLLSGLDVEAKRGKSELSFVTKGMHLSPKEEKRLSWALRIGALCNNASLGDGADGQSGDPMEIALLVAARDAGTARDDILKTHEELREYAFDADTKMMANVHRRDDGYDYVVKGAPEAVMAACNSELGPDGPCALDQDRRTDWAARGALAAKDGLRLLALAMKQDVTADAEPYEGLTLVGLVCLQDPLRVGVRDAIHASRRAGVRVVMLTGDHADTAEAIAQEAGLGEGELAVIEGREWQKIETDTEDPTVRARVLAADVFARVTPATKLALVSLYQQAGHVVAMTGDGVNDAPSLKKADIGIAMGQRGTQVARQAADMVLKDDSLHSIIDAMRQGRVIFANIRKFVVYLMSCNVSELLVVGLAFAIGLPTPILPLQILFLNLVTDVFPAFALGLGKGDDHEMERPPRDPEEQILDRPRWILLGLLGAVITLVTLGAFGLALFWLKVSPAAAVTVAFLTLAFAQLWNVFNVRSPESGMLRNDVTRNRYVWGALALCLGLIIAALWHPGLSGLLGLPYPGISGVGLAAGMSLLPLVFGQALLATGGFDWLVRYGQRGKSSVHANADRPV